MVPTLRLRDALAVFVGGTVGTAARVAITLIPGATWEVLAVPTVNLLGALLLGLFTGAAAKAPRLARFRLLVGTGMLGGFTTYSALAVGAADDPLLAGITALLGVVAAIIGLMLGRKIVRA